MKELDRIIENKLKGIPEIGIAIVIRQKIPDDSFKKLIELMTSIIDIEGNDFTEDSTWEMYLPDWFVTQTKSIDIKEAWANSELWRFGSWIDAIKQRGWKWWNYKILDDKTIIYFEALTYPYVIDPFYYMLYTIGIKGEVTEFLEIYPGSNTLKIT